VTSKNFQSIEWVEVSQTSSPGSTVRIKCFHDLAITQSLLDAGAADRIGTNTRPLTRPFWIYIHQESYRVTHQTDITIVRTGRSNLVLNIPTVRDLKAASPGYKSLVPAKIMRSQQLQPADLICQPGDIVLFLGADHLFDLI
jgi:hypothetical protein